MVAADDVRRITWHIFWQTTLVGLVGGFLAGAVVGFLTGMIVGMAGGDTRMVQQLSGITGGIAGLVVNFFALNFFLARAIGKNVGGKQLELLAPSTADMPNTSQT